MPQLKNIALALANPWLRKAAPKRFPIDRSEVRSILIYRPERIGDVFVSLPLIDALRIWHPAVEISIVVSPASLPLVENDPRFHQLIVFRKDVGGVLALRRALRSQKFDIVIDLVCDDSVSALLYTHLFTSARYYLGMGKSNHAGYYHMAVPYRSTPPRHVIDNTLALGEAFGLYHASPYSPIYFSSSEQSSAKEWFDSLKRKGRDQFVGINLSAGSESRRWPDEQIIKLIHLLNRDEHTAVILICTPNDRHTSRPIIAAGGPHVYTVPDGMSFTAAAAYVSELSLLVSPDTSLIHVARAFDVPVVGLYTRFMDNFKLWYPYGQPEGVVLAAGSENVRDIGAEQVYATVTRLFSLSNESKA